MSKIYQFKITLKETKPKIWRRIQVPEEYDFAELSSAILCAMGWSGGHLHEFRINDPQTGGEKVRIRRPLDENDISYVDEKEAKMKKYFTTSNVKAIYEYDFGDCWEHKVVLESILPAVEGETYPKWTAGKMQCPPEDVGGTDGYYNLLAILNKSDEESRAQVEWYQMVQCDEIDPLKFDPEKVTFYSHDETEDLINSLLFK